MKKCSKCQCANDDEAKYCRKCGFEFTSMPWWKRIGFIPVRDFKIKNSNLLLCIMDSMSNRFVRFYF